MITDVRKHYCFAADSFVANAVVQAGSLNCGLYCFEPGQRLPPMAGEQAKMCYVLEGTGLFTLGGQASYVSAGGLISIDANELHSVVNPGPGRLVILAVTGEA